MEFAVKEIVPDSGRFAILKDHMADNFYVKDLDYMEEDEFVELIRSKSTECSAHLCKMFWRQFIRDHLFDYMCDYKDEYSLDYDEEVDGKLNIQMKEYSTELNLRNCVSSRNGRTVPVRRRTNYKKIPIHKLSNALYKFDINRTAVRTLTLTANGLDNESLPDIINFMATFPNLKVVRLDYNMFRKIDDDGDTWKYVREILRDSRLKFVNLAGNNIMSIDSRETFKQLTAEEVSKMIFLLVGWYKSTSAYLTMFPHDEQMRELSRKAHCEYYDKYHTGK